MRRIEDLPLVGRKQELTVLLSILEEALPGRLRAALVLGEAGIGKTRLIEEAALAGKKLGFAVALGRCDRSQSPRSCGPFLEALLQLEGGRPGASRMSKLLRASDQARSPESFRFILIEEVLASLETAALAQPLLLILEDLHWSDPETVAVIISLTKRLTFAPLLLLLSSRPTSTPPSDGLAEAFGAAGQSVIELDQLSQEEVGLLTAAMVEAEPDESLLEIVSGAAGNPFLITEAINSLLKEGSIAVAGGRASTPLGHVPTDFALIARKAMSSLPDSTQRLLNFASLLSEPFSATELAAVVGTPVRDLLTDIQSAIEARVIAGDGEGFRFRHDLLRQAIYHHLPQGARAALHAEAGRALKDSGASVVQVSEQYFRGAKRGDQAAFQALFSAAMSLRDSPSAQIPLFEKALDLVVPGQSDHHEILASLAEAKMTAGYPSEAEAIATEMLSRGHDHPLAPRMREVVLRALKHTYRYSEVKQVTEEWLDLDVLDAKERSMLLTRQVDALDEIGGFEYEVRMQKASEALSLAEQTGDKGCIVEALVALASCTRDRAEATDLLERGLRMADDLPDRGARYMPHLALGNHLLVDRSGFNYEEAGRAEDVYRKGLALAEEHGRAHQVPVYLAPLAVAYWMGDRWDDAVAEAEAAFAAATEMGRHERAAIATLAYVAIRRGDLVAARRYIQVEEDADSRLGYESHPTSMSHRGNLLEVEGRLDEAFGLYWQWFSSRDPSDAAFNWWRCLWLALALNHPDKAEIVVRTVEQQVGSATTEDDAHLARALLSGNASAVVRAIDRFEALGWNQDRREQAAVSLALVGRPADAAHHLEELERWHEKVRAEASFDQLVRHLGTLGVTYRRKRRRKRPRVGWESLTTTEQRIAEFAAGGLTNRQIGERMFISPRTVQTHLAHIFEKLSLASRVELAALVAQRKPSATAYTN